MGAGSKIVLRSRPRSPLWVSCGPYELVVVSVCFPPLTDNRRERTPPETVRVPSVISRKADISAVRTSASARGRHQARFFF